MTRAPKCHGTGRPESLLPQSGEAVLQKGAILNGTIELKQGRSCQSHTEIATATITDQSLLCHNCAHTSDTALSQGTITFKDPINSMLIELSPFLHDC